MKTYKGTAKVKDGINSIYKGLTLPIIEVNIEYKNGRGMGVYADGSRDYRLSLLNTIFVESHKYTNTVLHDTKLEDIQLFETITFPLSREESKELVKYIKDNPDKDLNDWIEGNTKPSILPEHDLSTLYERDEDWVKYNFQKKLGY